jgi:pilus assembly protein CpaF
VVTIRDLLRNSLRMRPDRIIVGEVRGGEVLEMLQAMSTGHDGSMGTIHASSPRECLYRLEMLAGFAGFQGSESACAARSPTRSTSSCRSAGCPTASGASCRSPK